ncbi:MAG: hypothetical protein D4R97_06945 [Bacteroidetes bacterium]|nr:MAG: hypothetical protein D4R97_06945 [Bacteroidota bacterium]
MKLWIKIILGLAVAGIGAALLIYHFVINKPHPDFEKIKPDYSLNAGAFYNEFKTSKENAHKLYNGKVIEITGKLARVESADTLTIAVFVFNQGMFGDEGIRCTVSKKFNPETKKLKPDGIIRIKGYCTGFNETDVIMEHCSLIY